MSNCYVCGRPATTSQLVVTNVYGGTKTVDMCIRCQEVHNELKKRHEFESYKELEKIRGTRVV